MKIKKSQLNQFVKRALEKHGTIGNAPRPREVAIDLVCAGIEPTAMLEWISSVTEEYKTIIKECKERK